MIYYGDRTLDGVNSQAGMVTHPISGRSEIGQFLAENGEVHHFDRS